MADTDTAASLLREARGYVQEPGSPGTIVETTEESALRSAELLTRIDAALARVPVVAEDAPEDAEALLDEALGFVPRHSGWASFTKSEVSVIRRALEGAQSELRVARNERDEAIDTVNLLAKEAAAEMHARTDERYAARKELAALRLVTDRQKQAHEDEVASLRDALESFITAVEGARTGPNWTEPFVARSVFDALRRGAAVLARTPLAE